MHYSFDWDPNKERENIRKHGIAFRRAALVFRDANHLSAFDEKHSDDEDRWITMGLDGSGVMIVVAHTYVQVKEDLCQVRIISARKTTDAEASQYSAINR